MREVNNQPLPLMYVAFQQEVIDGKTVHQIYLYDDIEEFGKFNWNTWTRDESQTSAKYFAEKLNEIPDGERIELFINSRGGSVKEGTAIFNQLKRKNSYVTGVVDGVAHSIAFTILQGCDKRVMGQGTSALIHEMWISCMGNADQLRAEAEKLDQWMQSSRALFMSRAKGITEDELSEMMKKETVLTPQTALQYGFIDEIAEGEKEKTQQTPNNQDLKEMRQQFQKHQDFGENLKEFMELNKAQEAEEKQETSTNHLGAFFNAFL